MLSRCASSSDTVREIKYQILHTMLFRRRRCPPRYRRAPRPPGSRCWRLRRRCRSETEIDHANITIALLTTLATLAPAQAPDIRFHDAQGRVTPALSAFGQTGH